MGGSKFCFFFCKFVSFLTYCSTQFSRRIKFISRELFFNPAVTLYFFYIMRCLEISTKTFFYFFYFMRCLEISTKLFLFFYFMRCLEISTNFFYFFYFFIFLIDFWLSCREAGPRVTLRDLSWWMSRLPHR